VLGLALRQLVLAGSFEPLRAALTEAVVRTLGAVGVAAARLEPAMLGVGADRTSVTVPCTHLEVVALLAPLCWDRARSALHKVALVLGGAAVVALAIPRLALAVGLLRAGVPWAYGHDVLLGALYFALVALVLAAGAWTQPSQPSRPTRASRRARASAWAAARRLGVTERARSRETTSGAGPSACGVGPRGKRSGLLGHDEGGDGGAGPTGCGGRGGAVDARQARGARAELRRCHTGATAMRSMRWP
jgi:hypothetical protein